MDLNTPVVRDFALEVKIAQYQDASTTLEKQAENVGTTGDQVVSTPLKWSKRVEVEEFDFMTAHYDYDDDDFLPKDTELENDVAETTKSSNNETDPNEWKRVLSENKSKRSMGINPWIDPELRAEVEYLKAETRKRLADGTMTAELHRQWDEVQQINESGLFSRRLWEQAKAAKAAEASERKERRKKKKGAKKIKKETKKTANLAVTVVRGFTPTPAPSGDEDSDFSNGRLKPREFSIGQISVTSSPALRPISSAGGISTLRKQLDELHLGPTPVKTPATRSPTTSGIETPNSPGATSGSGTASDSEPPEMNTYDVPLVHDFTSIDAEQEDPYGMMIDDVKPKKMTAKDFERISCLGKGSFGTVHLVKQATTGRLFAQKMFRKASLTVHKRLIEQTKTERAILESINNHPFVVKLYYAFQDQEKLYLILEYAQGGELFHHLAQERMFPEDTTSFYMAEMILALEHLHQTVGVVYRDLKPENCLLDAEGHLLLTDFGLSKVAVNDDDRSNSTLGTLEYMAPEVVLGHFYGSAVDWYSLGAVGFDLLTGSPPFRANNNKRLEQKIVKDKLSFPYFLSPDAKDLLTRLLRKDPLKRLGGNMPKDMVVMKTHRFFRKINWANLEKRAVEPPIRPLITDPELAENFSADFTSLALSPTTTSFEGFDWPDKNDEANPFGGFSYVASSSMLNRGGFLD